MTNGIRTGDPRGLDSIKDAGRSSVKIPEFDKHVVEITIKVKTIVRKPLLIENSQIYRKIGKFLEFFKPSLDIFCE